MRETGDIQNDNPEIGNDTKTNEGKNAEGVTKTLPVPRVPRGMGQQGDPGCQDVHKITNTRFNKKASVLFCMFENDTYTYKGWMTSDYFLKRAFGALLY
jgi:hypothetical protein